MGLVDWWWWRAAAAPQLTDIWPDHDLGSAGPMGLQLNCSHKLPPSSPVRRDLTQPLRMVEASLTTNQLISKPSTRQGLSDSATYLSCFGTAFYFFIFFPPALSASLLYRTSMKTYRRLNFFFFYTQVKDLSPTTLLILLGE